MAAIQDDFGIPIQHYIQHFMELDFASFADVVQSIGGVHMYFPEPVYDRQVGLDIESRGCVYLNGGDALKLVRSRELQYKGPGVTSSNHSDWTRETQSALAGIRRDHEFLRVVATAVSRQGLGNPLTDEKLVADIAPQVEMDTALKGQLLTLLMTFRAVNGNRVPQFTLPIQLPNSTATYVYLGVKHGEVVYPSESGDEHVIDQLLGTGPKLDTMTGGPLPAPSSVSVSVMNGSGVTNQATVTGAALTALGFHVGSLGDTTPVGSPAETMVSYASSKYEADAEVVTRSLSGLVVMELNPTSSGSDVTVTTGTDFSVHGPPSSAPSATSSESPSSSPLSGSAASRAVTSPTPPWRICNRGTHDPARPTAAQVSSQTHRESCPCWYRRVGVCRK